MLLKIKIMLRRILRTLSFKILAAYGGLSLIIIIILSISVYGVVLYSLRTTINSQLDNNLHSIVTVVRASINVACKNYLRKILEKKYEVLKNCYNECKENTISDDDARQMVLDALREEVIGQTGFIYVLNSRGEYITFIDQDQIGKSVWSAQDINGAYYIQNIVSKAINMQSNDLDYEIYSVFDKSGNIGIKVDVFSYFEEWDWIIIASVFKKELSWLVDPQDFRNDIVSLKMGRNSSVEIFNSKDVQIVHSARQFEESIRKTETHDRIKSLKNGLFVTRERLSDMSSYTYVAPGAPDARSSRMINKLYKFYYVPEIDWYVVFGIDKDEVYANANLLAIIGVVCTSALFILMILFSIFVSKIIFLNNIRKLLRAVHRFSRKEFEARVTITSKDEIATLGKNFNFMAEMIQIYSENLEKSNKAYSALNKSLEKKVEERTRDLISKNKQLMDSITYASTIQHSILPREQVLQSVFKDHFVLWKPRDIVGGDFYWFKKTEKGFLLAVADCTGHGVPGAFMTMSTYSILNRIVEHVNNDNPSVILNRMNQLIKTLLNQDVEYSLSDDGLDMGLVYYETEKKKLVFAGARNRLLVKKRDTLLEIKGDLQSIGYKNCRLDYEYKNHEFQITGGEQFYLITDGFIDQNGGPKEYCFGRKRFTKMILEHAEVSMPMQKNIFEKKLKDYMGTLPQIDDITVVGFKV